MLQRCDILSSLHVACHFSVRTLAILITPLCSSLGEASVLNT